jgi:hypothetical protein
MAMKKLILLTTLFVSNLMFGFTIQSKITVSITGEIEKYLEMNCNPLRKDSTCLQLCTNQVKCVIPEVICQDCGTKQSQLMYSIFTDVNTLFKSDTKMVDTNSVISFLKNKKFISIPPDLFINMINPEKKDVLKVEFEKLCPTKVNNAILLATVNEQNKADQLVGVICNDNIGSTLLPIQLNPDFSNAKSDFWDIINGKMSQKMGDISLRLTTQLSRESMHKIRGAQEISNTIERQSITIPFDDSPNWIHEVNQGIKEREKQNGGVPSICKSHQFSDGTSQSVEEEYYQKCVKNKKRK